MFNVLILIGFVISIILTWLVLDMKKELKSNQENNETAPILERLAILAEQNKSLSFQNSELRQTVDSKLSQTNQATREQIGQSIKSISAVTEKLVKIEETNKQVVNFSAQLKNLQDILKNPKQRGVLGEYFLEETLKNVLPPNSYQMQYKVGKSREGKDLIVDAVVFVKEKVVPVDSKFSLENYEKILNTQDAQERNQLEKIFKQDLKKRIDETAKYIRPDEGTMDFAFMFIPSEAVYYDLLINKVGSVQISTRDLIEYAFQDKKVIIVSPTSFLAYLQTVLQGLRALKIEENTKIIRINVEKLGKHLIVFDSYMKKVANTLGTTVNHFNTAYKEFGKVDKDVAKITDGKRKIEPETVDKPDIR